MKIISLREVFRCSVCRAEHPEKVSLPTSNPEYPGDPHYKRRRARIFRKLSSLGWKLNWHRSKDGFKVAWLVCPDCYLTESKNGGEVSDNESPILGPDTRILLTVKL